MHLLGELADQTWSRLEALLANFDDSEQERRAFLDDTRQFFHQRLSIYEQRRIELEKQIDVLRNEVYRLCDELQLPRTSLEIPPKLSLKDKDKYLREQIDLFKTRLFERDKELIQLRETIRIRRAVIGLDPPDTEQILSTSTAHTILSDLTQQLKKLQTNLQDLLAEVRSLNPTIADKHSSLIQSFVSINDTNQSAWLTAHQPLTGRSLHSRLQTDYDQLHQALLAEVIRLRQELGQKEPPPPYDLKRELDDLRLRQRYLALLASFPHQLTARSTLEEIRRTYEELTASMRAKAREKLKSLWDQLDVPEEQRVFPKTSANDDDYLAINDEIIRLEIYVESIRPLLVKIQKREWYKREMVEFEKHAGDPARLRGSSTQLLKEERFRKDLSREFPKLTDDLRRTVAEWEETSSKKLIYGGEPYLDTMNKEKLSVDFELLHLRLLTKCQLLVQPIKDQTMSLVSQSPSPPSTPPTPTPTRRSPFSSQRSSASRIPTMSFTNSQRKINKAT